MWKLYSVFVWYLEFSILLLAPVCVLRVVCRLSEPRCEAGTTSQSECMEHRNRRVWMMFCRWFWTVTLRSEISAFCALTERFGLV